MYEQEDEKVTYYKVHGKLGEPIYRFRWLFFKLTTEDLFACLMGFVVALNVTDYFGWGKVKLFLSLPLDPWGWILFSALIATSLSVLHILRPEGDIWRIVFGVFSPRYYAPRTLEGDEHWRPSPHRMAHRLRSDGSEFRKPLMERFFDRRTLRKAA